MTTFKCILIKLFLKRSKKLPVLHSGVEVKEKKKINGE